MKHGAQDGSRSYCYPRDQLGYAEAKDRKVETANLRTYANSKALAWGERPLHEMPLDEARSAARRLMEAFPTYTLTLQRQINPWPDKVFDERYVEALGVPE
ncbi:hypothetical protein [Mesorhizobium sp. M0496]|uniref:hypothetical protein n=1 Tax=Mesorhizobium sp. M0496 TaxID=2956952 RepID=UPI00333C3C34